MRPSPLLILSALFGCAPETQTAFLGECPEGTELSDHGDCVETDAGNATNESEDGNVSGDPDGEVGDDEDEDTPAESPDDDSAGENDEDGDGEDEANSDVPEDLDPLEVDVTAKSYAIDLGSAEWVKPDVSLLTGFLGDALDVKVLMSVEEADDETLDLVGALPEDPESEELVQDTCLPTLDLDPIDFDSSPYFEVGPTDFPIDLMGVSLTIVNMNIKGIFEPDGRGMYDIGIAGMLDLRDLASGFEGVEVGIPGMDFSDPESTCDLIGIFGIECEACPSDEEPACLAVELEDILADEVDTTVVPIAEDEIDEDCE